MGKNQFEKTINLTDVIIFATTPPEVDRRLLPLDRPEDTPSGAKLHVPADCKAAYAAATGWKDFEQCGGIYEDAPTGISTAKNVVSAGEERYTIDGRRANGAKGINIIRMSDGSTKKVVMRK